MKPNYRLLAVVISGSLLGAPALVAGPTLYDYLVNVNGSTYCPAGSINSCSNYGGVTAIPGVSGTFNPTTGLGDLTITFDPKAAGTYYIDAFAADYLALPAFNEYAAVNGSAMAGQSWQIDVPDYEPASNHAGTIIANTSAGKLDDTNHVPGSTDNYNLDCGAFGVGAADPGCNDNVSLAMGFKFTLTSTQQAVVTFTFSESNPGGFSLQQIHPIDGSSTSSSSLFLGSSLNIEPVCTGPNCGPPPVPEPASWRLLGAGLATAFGLRRYLARG